MKIGDSLSNDMMLEIGDWSSNLTEVKKGGWVRPLASAVAMTTSTASMVMRMPALIQALR